MVCLRNISVNTLHKGDTEDGDDDDNNNNNSNNNKHLEGLSLPSGMTSTFIFSASQNVN
jgi:hypothetical protein